MKKEHISEIATQMAISELSTNYPNVSYDDMTEEKDDCVVYKELYQIAFNTFYDEAEKELLKALEDGRHEPSPNGYCPITFLHRDDLIGQGFDAKNTEIDTISEIASKMGSAYQNEGYWIDLDIIAKDLDVKKIEGN